MSDRVSVPRGVTLIPARFIDPFGKRPAEFAFKTPRFPNGIRVSDLRGKSAQVQTETVLIWFWVNLKPSSDERLRPPGRGPYRANPWDPPAVLAMDAIFQAFGSVLGAETQTTLLRSLPGLWVWQEDLPPLDDPSALLARLDALSAAIGQLSASRPAIGGHGEVGHNLPPLFTLEEETEALKSLEGIKTALVADVEDRAPATQDQKSALRIVFEKTSAYVIARADDFIKGAASEGGKTLGKHYIHALLVWQYSDQVLAALGRR